MKRSTFVTYVLIVTLVWGFQEKVSSQNDVIKSHDISPIAADSSVITAGNARFTVLTSQLIRMEWDSLGNFEDRASLVFTSRKLDVPNFKIEMSDSQLTIFTADLQ